MCYQEPTTNFDLRFLCLVG
uniref:Uncharacterized protein n=1 Tax=Anguilla anguilla TaxID=7936 RepID=A0A0E9Q8R7_ANGAN